MVFRFLGLRSSLTFAQATKAINHACVSGKLPEIYTPPIAIFDEFIVEQGYFFLEHLVAKQCPNQNPNARYRSDYGYVWIWSTLGTKGEGKNLVKQRHVLGLCFVSVGKESIGPVR